MYFTLLLSCFPELPDRNFPPFVQVLSPNIEEMDADLVPYNVGSDIPFEFQIMDMDSDYFELDVILYSSIDGQLYQGAPDSSGNIQIVTTLSAGMHYLNLTVRDEANITSESFQITVNTPPPSPIVTIIPNNPTTEDDLYVDIQSLDDAEDDDVIYSIEWLRGGIVEPNQSSVDLEASLTSKDERWYVRVTPSDGYTEGDPAEASVIIANSPPVIHSISINPEDVFNDSLLTCETSTSDINNDSISIDYHWKLWSNGTMFDLTGNSSQFVAYPSEIQPNDRVYCQAEVDDGDTVTASEAQVLIQNRTPIVTELLVLSDSNVRSGASLNCLALGNDPDVGQTEWSFQWRSGVDDVSGSLLGITPALELTPQNATKGEGITCFATITDEFGLSNTSSSHVVVENTPPTMNFVLLSPILPTAEDDIFCYAGAEDSDPLDTVTLEYQWYVNGLPIAPTTDTLSASDGYYSYLDEITCTVVPSDATDVGDGMSNTVQINNSPPQIYSVDIEPADIYTDTTAIAIVNVQDPDDQPVSLTYTWYVDESLIQTGIYNYLDGTDHFDKGQSIRVEVFATDSVAQSSSVSSLVYAQNSPPLPPEVYLSEYSLIDNSLYCEMVEPAIDLDGDTINYVYSWENSQGYLSSGLLTTEHVDDTVSTASLTLAEQYICTVTADDGDVSVTTQVDTTMSACDVKSIYDVEEDLRNIYNPSSCWEIGKTHALPPESFSPFLTSGNNSGIDTYCFDHACAGHNTTDTTVFYNYALFPANSIAFHSDTNINSGFRWQAPINGDCQVDIQLIGYTSYLTASTNANVSLYHADSDGTISLLDSKQVQGFQIPEDFDVSVEVSSGDYIYLLSSGSWIYNWLGVVGDISCFF